jgi:hypothetical protein
MPTVYVSRRLGRASDIAHLLEQGGCSIRLGPAPAEATAVTRFSPDEIARYFGSTCETPGSCPCGVIESRR